MVAAGAGSCIGFYSCYSGTAVDDDDGLHSREEKSTAVDTAAAVEVEVEADAPEPEGIDVAVVDHHSGNRYSQLAAGENMKTVLRRLLCSLEEYRRMSPREIGLSD